MLGYCFRYPFYWRSFFFYCVFISTSLSALIFRCLFIGCFFFILDQCKNRLRTWWTNARIALINFLVTQTCKYMLFQYWVSLFSIRNIWCACIFPQKLLARSSYWFFFWCVTASFLLCQSMHCQNLYSYLCALHRWQSLIFFFLCLFIILSFCLQNALYL